MTPARLFLRLDMSKDETTFKWLNTLKSTRTQIHKPNLAGRPTVSGNGGPTERISSFIDSLIQPIDKKQKSYIKDATDFVHFVENKRHFQTTQSSLLYILDVCSLYTNIPQEEGIEVVCQYYNEHSSERMTNKWLTLETSAF